MLQDAIQAQQSPPPAAEQVSIDELSSPISARIFELYESDLFQDTLQNSEVTSSSNGCYEDNSPYAANFSLASDTERNFNMNNNLVNTPTTTTTTSTTATSTTNTTNNTANNSSNLSILFDSQEELDNDISASIDFSSSPSFSVPSFLTTQQDHFNFSCVQPQISLGAGSHADGVPQYIADTVPALMGASLVSMFEEDCLSSVPSYVPLHSSSTACSFISPAMSAYMTSTGHINTPLSADSSGMFNGNIILGSEMQPKDLDYQGENGGIYCPDSRVFNAPDLRALACESQQLVAGPGSAASLTPAISALEDSAFKVGKLSVEQRKEKIHRYMKKRNQRNFSKKIKYACRKTLADSRPRVRGRFAKNDEFSETQRQASSNREEEDEEEVVVKVEEDDMVDSSDIFAHISGVNSFKCNYSLQTWN